MSTKTNSAIQNIKKNGIADPWQKFGMLLSNDGAVSTILVREIFTGRKNAYANLKEIHRLFADKQENLQEAKSLLSDIMAKYDSDGIWHELDLSIKELDIEEALGTLQEDFGQHPFPIVLNSLKFNWNFMKEKGVREFYVMTQDYLDKLVEVTNDGLLRFNKELQQNQIEPYWLLKMDLNSIETPCHCDVCRLTISYILEIKAISEKINTPEYSN